jgi:hypothetical protein
MEESGVTSHFWIASSGEFSSTLLVVADESVRRKDTSLVTCSVYDVDGSPVQDFQVEYPVTEVGVIELEPFVCSLKMRGGLAHGHLVVRSEAGLSHFCRHQMGKQSALVPSMRLSRGREMSFMPLLLGSHREHALVLLNDSEGEAQVVLRLMYGTRSPEWTVQVPSNGTRLVSLEHELLPSFDDSSWKKGITQGYLRVSPRGSGGIASSVIERVVSAEGGDELHRWIGV